MHSPIEKFLNSAEGAANVLSHARLLFQLNQRYRQQLPQTLACASRIANLKSGFVIIHADNGAVASKLRQMSARLLKDLSIVGAQFSGVEVKVQPRGPSRAGPEPRVKPISNQAQAALEAVRKELPRDSELGRALQTLIDRAATPE